MVEIALNFIALYILKAALNFSKIKIELRTKLFVKSKKFVVERIKNKLYIGSSDV